MQTYEIDLFRSNGARDCLLAIVCANDLAAIVFARLVLRLNRQRVAELFVRRDDAVIFEQRHCPRLN